MIFKFICFAILLFLKNGDGKPYNTLSQELQPPDVPSITDEENQEKIENLRNAIYTNNALIASTLDVLDNDNDELISNSNAQTPLKNVSLPIVFVKFTQLVTDEVNSIMKETMKYIDSLESRLQNGKPFPSLQLIESDYAAILRKHNKALRRNLNELFEQNVNKNNEMSSQQRESYEKIVESFTDLSFKYFTKIFNKEIENPEELKILDEFEPTEIINADGYFNKDNLNYQLDNKPISDEEKDKVVIVAKELEAIFKEFQQDVTEVTAFLDSNV